MKKIKGEMCNYIFHSTTWNAIQSVGIFLPLVSVHLYEFIVYPTAPFGCIFLPEMCEKHCVKTAITNPDDKAVASRTDDTDAPTPAPAAEPQTMKTYKNDAKHSAIIDLIRRETNWINIIE